MSKASIELSSTFLVWFIIGVVVFLLGLTFFYTLYNNAEIPIPDSVELALESCIDRNEKVCFPETRIDLGRKQTHMFYGVINNVLQTEKIFKIRVEFAGGLDNNGNELTPSHKNARFTIQIKSLDSRLLMIGLKREFQNQLSKISNCL